MRKIFIKFLKGISFLLLLIPLYFTLAAVCSIIPVNSSSEEKEEPPYEIFIESNGVHTDIVFPLHSSLFDFTALVDPGHTISGDIEYKFIAFGWGDLEFYKNTPQWADLTPKIAFKALFLKTPAAMHVQFKKYLIENEDVIPVKLSESEYIKLADYIKNSFELDEKGYPQPIPNLHYFNNDVFYHGRGSLNLFYTCNTWTNNALKSAGLKASLWTPFAEGIFYHYR